nr:uncharacterized protein LOC103414716 [Malus domestica]
MVEKSTAILQEATSQLPPETPIEDIIVPKDADVQIVTEVLDQKFGRRHGKVVRCTGKAGVRETGASSSRLSTGEVKFLEGGSDNPKRSGCGPGREDEYDSSGLSDVRPPNPDDAST